MVMSLLNQLFLAFPFLFVHGFAIAMAIENRRNMPFRFRLVMVGSIVGIGSTILFSILFVFVTRVRFSTTVVLGQRVLFLNICSATIHAFALGCFVMAIFARRDNASIDISDRNPTRYSPNTIAGFE